MKQIITICAALLVTAYVYAQVPQKMSYQAVIRNSSNTLVINQSVGMRLSILQGSSNGTPVYVETQMASTNANGLVSMEIGTGTIVSGTFASIVWANGPYFIKTETDPSGGTNYTISGTSELMSVPYALFSANSTPGPQGPEGLLTSGTIPGNTPYWNGSQWVVNNSNIHNNGAGVGIGTTAPNASAKVEIASTTQGFLPPRMTSAQRDAIISPAPGLTIYNTTSNCLQWWNGIIWFDGCGNNAPVQPQYPVGSVFCAGTTTVVDVTSPVTGKIWMNRNLGAQQVAISSTDVNSYGDLYQWGRRSDGHQCRTSSTINTISSVDQPITSDFILSPNLPNDWLNPGNLSLWQGVNGINNPCPSGYRLPTEAEINAERLSWNNNNSSGAFVSPLKLPMAGYRSAVNGSLINVGVNGRYWTSTVSATGSRVLDFNSSNSAIYSNPRAGGASVRCIKD